MLFKKMFVFDLDGTLLTSEETVHPYTQQMIIEAKKQGHITTIATGRGIQDVLPLIHNGTIKGIRYLICSNGALIFDLKSHKTTVLGKISPKIYDEIEEFAVKNELIIFVDTEQFSGFWIPSSENSDYPYWLSDMQIEVMDLSGRCTKEELRKIVLDETTVVTQISLQNPQALAKDNTDIVRGFAGSDYSVFLTNAVFTDVNPLGISKYKGIKRLLLKTLTFKSSLIAFGDSGNDKEMLSNAKYGFALAKATEDAKEAANEVIGDKNTGTIGETIKRFLK